jgi:hypothetical protein
MALYTILSENSTITNTCHITNLVKRIQLRVETTKCAIFSGNKIITGVPHLMPQAKKRIRVDARVERVA